MKSFTKYFISILYVGSIGKFPGTIASIVSIIILYPLFVLNYFNWIILTAIFIFLTLFSLYAIHTYSKETNTHDSKFIVIDEFLGIYLIFLFYNYIFIYSNFITIFLIFLLFRFFDITKIYPANIIDKKMLNAFGVIIDDLIASVYTILTLLILNEFIK
tara:strand:+ start:270 stop:746 length:477 start_codon:yes stop_codon:yes gene_type:complete